MNGRTEVSRIRYTVGMDGAIVVIALVVALVAIDMIGRLRERPREPVDTGPTSERVVVDFSDREPPN